MNKTIVEKMKYNPLTDGKISIEIIKFAIPFFLAFILQGLYSAVDLIFIGHYTSAAELSGVSIGSNILHAITILFVHLSTGSTVLIGNRFGAKDHEGTAHAIGTSFTIFGVIALAMSPIIYYFLDTIIHLMQTPSEAVAATKTYVSTIILGIPFIIGYNIVSATFRGLGDSKTPLYFITLACILNIILDYIFIAELQWSVFGAALATSVSQSFSFISALIYFRSYKKRFDFNLNRRHLLINIASAKEILKVGFPLAIQHTLVQFSFLIISAIVNSLGVIASASVGIVEKILFFGFFAPVSLSSAVATITAQNMGAKQENKALESLKYGIIYSILFGLVTFSVSQLTPELLAKIFTDNQELIYNASQYLLSFSFEFLIVGIVFCSNAYFTGRGNAVFPLVQSLIATFAVRIPVSYYYSIQPDVTLRKLGTAAPLASITSVVLCFAYLYFINKNKNLEIQINPKRVSSITE